ncbi:hypothetical protein ROHU_001577 [Labeo rohita]|uniref:Uncharacterized protein n=1 Tax=Labeo rohita TaxID=84645 RepID=A0A498P1K2_LABRO|nr:hypothetical protein ROHU_001577 [Labeo rohita]
MTGAAVIDCGGAEGRELISAAPAQVNITPHSCGEGWKSSVIGSLQAAGWEKPCWAGGGCIGADGGDGARSALREHILYRTLPERPPRTS